MNGSSPTLVLPTLAHMSPVLYSLPFADSTDSVHAMGSNWIKLAVSKYLPQKQHEIRRLQDERDVWTIRTGLISKCLYGEVQNFSTSLLTTVTTPGSSLELNVVDLSLLIFLFQDMACHVVEELCYRSCYKVICYTTFAVYTL